MGIDIQSVAIAVLLLTADSIKRSINVAIAHTVV